jgi:hypothetical protein
MRLQVLLAAGLKTTVFWDVALYNLIEIDCHFKSGYCLHHEGSDEGSKHL